HALGSVVDQLLARPAGRRNAATELVEGLPRNIDMEGPDLSSSINSRTHDYLPVKISACVRLSRPPFCSVDDDEERLPFFDEARAESRRVRIADIPHRVNSPRRHHQDRWAWCLCAA